MHFVCLYAITFHTQLKELIDDSSDVVKVNDSKIKLHHPVNNFK